MLGSLPILYCLHGVFLYVSFVIIAESRIYRTIIFPSCFDQTIRATLASIHWHRLLSPTASSRCTQPSTIVPDILLLGMVEYLT